MHCLIQNTILQCDKDYLKVYIFSLPVSVERHNLDRVVPTEESQCLQSYTILKPFPNFIVNCRGKFSHGLIIGTVRLLWIVLLVI